MTTATARALGPILFVGAVAASCQSAEPVAVERGALDTNAADAGTSVPSTSLVFHRVFLDGPGSPQPSFSDVRWIPALAVGPGDDIWIAGRFSSSLKIGTTEPANADGWDELVARLDPHGNPRWARRLGGPGHYECGGMALDAEGNAIVAVQPHLELVKLNADGDLLWRRPVTLPSGGLLGGVAAAAADRAGGILLVGAGDGSTRVTRVDADGNTLWSVDSLPGAEAWPVGMAVDSRGSTIIGEGSTVGPHVRLQKVSASGGVWLKRRLRGFGYGSCFYSVGADLQDNILLSGFAGVDFGEPGSPLSTPPEHRDDPWIAKLSPGGTRIWQVFGVAGRLGADREGNVLCAKLDRNFGSVGKLDPSGRWIWKYPLRVDGDGAVSSVVADSAGRVFFAGRFKGRVDFGDGPIDSGDQVALFVAALAP